MNKQGFTLAEVLIALVVIGIVAAITLTTVMPNIQERVNSQRQANIVYKVTQATNLMKANGAMINGFESTDAFVDELQKYLKIMKRCDSEHIADCWPTKKVRTSEGKEYDVLKTKTRENLGFKDDYKMSKNVGIILADGASLIMTYNPINTGLAISDKLVSTTKELPVGGKYKEFLEYTTNTTAGLAFVMDVNGSKGPNSETIGTKMYDIRNLNGAHFSKGCGGKIIDGTCYTIIDSPSDYNCSINTTNKFCMEYPKGYSSDKLVGALIECAAMDSTLATRDELYDLCQLTDTEKENIGLDKSYYLSSTLCGEGYWCDGGGWIYGVNFKDGSDKCKKDGLAGRYGSSSWKILCISK